MDKKDANEIFADAKMVTCIGPPLGYFTICDPQDNALITIRYHALAVKHKDRNKVEEVMKLLLGLVASEVQDIYQDSLVIIFWRKELEIELRENGLWYAYCRLATSHRLSDIFWNRIEKDEGGEYRNAEDF